MNGTAGEVLTRIEKELDAMWTAPSVPGAIARSRACTMNLVIVGSVGAVDDKVEHVDEVTQSIPARAILVGLDPDAERDALEGEASAVCGIDGSTDICSERVRLLARGGVCARVASVVEDLCVSELPTAMVWLGRVHVDDPVFLSLARDVQRIVLDSEGARLAGLLAVTRWAAAEPQRPKVADLNWTRLAVWQEMCARFFDEPRLHPAAHKITRVTITQASPPGERLGVQGLLLLGWLATRLGWKATRLGGALRLRRTDGAPVPLKLQTVPCPPKVSQGSLAAVTIEAAADGVTMTGSLERQLVADVAPDADVLAWHLDTNGLVMEQRVRMRADRGAQLLERTLHRPASDPALIESVAFAGELGEDGLVCG